MEACIPNFFLVMFDHVFDQVWDKTTVSCNYSITMSWGSCSPRSSPSMTPWI